MRARRLVAAALLGVAAIVASGAGVGVGPAGAHEEVPGVRSVIDSVTPPLPEGVVVQARISVADQLLVENRTQTDLVVLGELGEPFLRIGPQGTFANLRSPTWYRSNDPTGTAVPPASASPDPATPPEWARATTEPAFGWFDHRLHRQVLASAPAVKEPGRPTVLEEWTVPMRYGDTDVVVKGHREYEPLSGTHTARVLDGPTELQVHALGGVVPALTVSRSERSGPPIVILGEGGEEMVRLLVDGIEVNEASPTWVFTQEAKGGFVRSGPVGAAEEPRWARQRAGQVTWLDRRGQLDASHAPAVGDAKEWEVPVLVGDTAAEIVAETSFVALVPAQRAPDDDDGGGWLPLAGGVVAGAVVGVAVWAVRGRLRLTRPSTSVGE